MDEAALSRVTIKAADLFFCTDSTSEGCNISAEMLLFYFFCNGRI